MTPELFAIFSQLVEEVSGLHYAERDRELFSSKVTVHAEARGFDALLDFYYRLRYDDPDGAETRQLIEALLVHETYFFRELPPLVELIDICIAPAVAKHGSARIWSAACSTGEEPFTLAMLLDQRGLLDRVEIIATDPSAASVATARTGRHSRRSLRGDRAPELSARYLELGDHGVTVAPRIRDAVKFSTLNLIDDDAHRELGIFDAVVCRNVLIYFTDEQIGRVIARVGTHLASGGLLAVGVSESLLRFGTTLVCQEHNHAFFYRRAM